MTDDATLSDFGATADRDGDDSVEADAGGDESSGVDEEPQIDEESGGDSPDSNERPVANGDPDAGPGISTYAWGETHTCAACGSSTDRAWRDDGEFVCGSCKRW